MSNPWAIAGPVIRARRKSLGKTQDQIKSLGGPSTALQRQVEGGVYEAEMHPAVKRGYEGALGWAQYSIDALLEGKNPVDVLGEVDTSTGQGLVDQAFVSPAAQDEPEFEFLTRVREDLTTEEMEQLMTEATPYLEMLVRDIKNRHREQS